MALQRLTHSGIAPPTSLGGPISASSLSFTITNATGYPTGAGGPFIIDIDAGTSSEEKIACQSLAGTTVTVMPGGRGFDGTTATAHSPAPNNVTHVCSSAELDDANAHIYTPSRDDHTQYVRTDGTRSITGGLTVAGALNVGGNLTAAGAATAEFFAVSGQAGIVGSARFMGGLGGAPSSGSFVLGDFIVDVTGAMWVCTANGTPGTWVKVGGSGAPSTAKVSRWAIAANQAIVGGAGETVVQFNTAVYDALGGFIPGGHYLSCPTTGMYRVTAGIGLVGGALGATSVQIFQNGTLEYIGGTESGTPTTGDGISSICGVLWCNAGDTVQIFAQSTNNNTIAQTVAETYALFELIQ